MASIFTKIIERTLPAYIVAEDEENIAFLDITPLTKGHTLVVPKKEVDYYFDLDEKSICSLTLFTQRVAKAMKKALPCQRIGSSIVGLEVPHTHIHLIPINNVGDMSFSRPKLSLNKEEMQTTADLITKNFQ